MSRMGRSHTRLTYAASITWSQAKVILSMYWRHCFAGAFLFSFLSIVFAFTEPPRYRSKAVVKVNAVEAAKSQDISVLASMNKKDLIDSQIKLLQMTEFEEELKKIVANDPENNQLNLAWGIGEKFRLSLLFNRIGISQDLKSKVDINTLSGQELLALFSAISEIKANHPESAFEIQVDALQPETAQKVAAYLAEGYIKTSDIFYKKEVDASMLALRKQKEDLRKRLVDSEEALREFYRENPLLANEADKQSVSKNANSLKSDYNAKIDELNSNRRLLEFYKKRFSSFMKNSDTTTEVFDKFKQELIELKYRRKKFLFQGYTEDNPGIKEIDEKIINVEKILNSAGDMSGRNVVSVGHEAELSKKIVELQDTIKKEEIELDQIEKRMKAAEQSSKMLPDQQILLDNFQRDVRIARELFEDVSKRIEVTEIKNNTHESILTLLPTRSYAYPVKSLPTGSRLFFSFLVGLVFTAAATIIFAIIRKKVIDELNVAEMGFKYAGDLKPSNSNKAKVLLSLGCNYRSDKGDAAIVLCSSPKGNVGVSQVLLLTDYLAKQKERSLFIIVGEIDISDHFQLRANLQYAKVFCSADNSQFILQISDEETLYSIRECLEITERQYKVKFSMVFLYIDQGAECLAYPHCQQLADKLLLIGPSATCSSWEYFRLVEGFQNLDEVYVSLTEAKRPKLPWSKKADLKMERRA